MPTVPVWRGTGCSSLTVHLSRSGTSAATPKVADTGADGCTHAQAWSAFWLEQGSASRCLANVDSDIRRLLSDHWAALAGRLAPSARILDIGCGAGIVGFTLLAAQNRLRITGIDLARVPAPSDRRVLIVPETPMENLPFNDGSFDAAVSQFGFEYGNVRAAAKELARVLIPGAPFSFVVHHAFSSILRQSRTRNRALRSLLGGAVKRAFLCGNAAELDRQIRSTGCDAPAEAIVGQVGQALHGRIGRSGTQRAAIWSAVAAALAPELKILDALEMSCVAPNDLDGWLAGLAGRFEVGTVSAMRRPTGEALAWKIEGVRSASAEGAAGT